MNSFKKVSAGNAILAVVCIAIAIRLLSFGYLSTLAASNPSALPYPILSGDSVLYAHYADNLLAFHAFEDVPGVPLRAWPPGYPALLAAMKWLTGSFTSVVILQLILSSLAVVLIFNMARTLVPMPYALIPSLVYALDPMAIFADTSVLTDGVFSAILVITVYLAFFRSNPRPLIRWGMVGVLIGIATMLRPIAEFFILVFPALFLLQEYVFVPEIPGRGLQWKSIGVFLIGCALVLLPWIARNEYYFHSFEITNLGANDLLGNDVKSFLAWRELAQEGRPIPAILVMRHASDPVFAQMDTQIAARLAAMTPQGADPNSYKGKLAAEYILHDPVRYTYFHAVNTIPLFISSSIASYGQIVVQLRDNTGFYAPAMLSLFSNLGQVLHPHSFRSFIGAVWSVAPVAAEIFFWLCATTLALFALVMRRRDFAVVLCAVLVAYFAAITGPMSSSRYRVPAEPYLLIGAVAGLQITIKTVREKLSRSVASKR